MPTKLKPTLTAKHKSLNAYLKATKQSKRALAKRLGVHPSTISLIARHKRAARWGLGQRLEKITGVPIKVFCARPRRRSGVKKSG
jgi:transcriptional regulator with XRE-family HTH domain